MISDYCFVSNSCIGYWLDKMFYDSKKTPLIGSLFLDDEQYVKFCENYDYYTSLEPKFGEAKNERWMKDFGVNRFRIGIINPNYVCMFLNDVEINWIHDLSENSVLSHYKERLEISKNHKKIFLWCDAEIFNVHNDNERKQLINRFNNINDTTIFLTKNKNEEYNDGKTIVHFVKEWENRQSDDRNSFFTPLWGDQIKIGEIFKEIIEKL